MHENIIGIDLGTTMSAIAKLNDLGSPEIIPNSDGERIMPSVIHFTSSHSILLGTEAKQAGILEPLRVVKEFKREMHNPNYKFIVDNREHTAYELSAIVLKKLVQDASHKIGKIDKVVITVPAYFKEYQRNATIEAGKIAGLNVIAIINEPTAAALFYAKESYIEGYGIVYDLGGGTFDITLTHTKGTTVQILKSEGDSKLGGIDFDKIILNMMKEKYRNITKEELYLDKKFEEEFTIMAEEVKKSLSKKSYVTKRLRGISSIANITITREEFEERASILISKTEMLLEQLLDDTEIEKINYVLLVGGSTRIPAIRKSIKNIVGKEALNAVNVDEAVALGAAIKAGIVMQNQFPNSVEESIKSAIKDLTVQDVANHSYGVILVDPDLDQEINEIVIEKDSHIPCVKKTIGLLNYDGQKDVRCLITQGEGEEIEYIDIITTFNLSIDHYDTKKNDEIEYIYTYDENQIMHCQVTHLLSGRTIEHSINIKSLHKQSNWFTSNQLDLFLIE